MDPRRGTGGSPAMGGVEDNAPPIRGGGGLVGIEDVSRVLDSSCAAECRPDRSVDSSAQQVAGESSAEARSVHPHPTNTVTALPSGTRQGCQGPAPPPGAKQGCQGDSRPAGSAHSLRAPVEGAVRPKTRPTAAPSKGRAVGIRSKRRVARALAKLALVLEKRRRGVRAKSDADAGEEAAGGASNAGAALSANRGDHEHGHDSSELASRTADTDGARQTATTATIHEAKQGCKRSAARPTGEHYEHEELASPTAYTDGGRQTATTATMHEAKQGCKRSAARPTSEHYEHEELGSPTAYTDGGRQTASVATRHKAERGCNRSPALPTNEHHEHRHGSSTREELASRTAAADGRQTALAATRHEAKRSCKRSAAFGGEAERRQLPDDRATRQAKGSCTRCPPSPAGAFLAERTPRTPGTTLGPSDREKDTFELRESSLIDASRALDLHLPPPAPADEVSSTENVAEPMQAAPSNEEVEVKDLRERETDRTDGKSHAVLEARPRKRKKSTAALPRQQTIEATPVTVVHADDSSSCPRENGAPGACLWRKRTRPPPDESTGASQPGADRAHAKTAVPARGSSPPPAAHAVLEARPRKRRNAAAALPQRQPVEATPTPDKRTKDTASWRPLVAQDALNACTMAGSQAEVRLHSENDDSSSDVLNTHSPTRQKTATPASVENVADRIQATPSNDEVEVKRNAEVDLHERKSDRTDGKSHAVLEARPRKRKKSAAAALPQQQPVEATPTPDKRTKDTASWRPLVAHDARNACIMAGSQAEERLHSENDDSSSDVLNTHSPTRQKTATPASVENVADRIQATPSNDEVEVKTNAEVYLHERKSDRTDGKSHAVLEARPRKRRKSAAAALPHQQRIEHAENSTSCQALVAQDALTACAMVAGQAKERPHPENDDSSSDVLETHSQKRQKTAMPAESDPVQAAPISNEEVEVKENAEVDLHDREADRTDGKSHAVLEARPRKRKKNTAALPQQQTIEATPVTDPHAVDSTSCRALAAQDAPKAGQAKERLHSDNDDSSSDILDTHAQNRQITASAESVANPKQAAPSNPKARKAAAGQAEDEEAANDGSGSSSSGGDGNESEDPVRDGADGEPQDAPTSSEMAGGGSAETRGWWPACAWSAIPTMRELLTAQRRLATALHEDSPRRPDPFRPPPQPEFRGQHRGDWTRRRRDGPACDAAARQLQTCRWDGTVVVVVAASARAGQDEAGEEPRYSRQWWPACLWVRAPGTEELRADERKVRAAAAGGRRPAEGWAASRRRADDRGNGQRCSRNRRGFTHSAAADAAQHLPECRWGAREPSCDRPSRSWWPVCPDVPLSGDSC
ncbi:hypothetical protein DIPPA_29406 [Diplonema papillatum]|nr:hypothetical protein DIPPA_29406 [Diplonema papillatum]